MNLIRAIIPWARRAGWLGALLLIVATAGEIPAAEIDLKVMSFNVRYASEIGANRWSDRRSGVKKTIRDEDPDLIGTQEGLYRQLREVAEDLPDYQWIGEGRNGGSSGEFMAIFFKKDKLEPMQYGHFWLSDSPAQPGSFHWGNTLPRMVTWVIFRDKKSGIEFAHWNTHFDHQSQPSREKSASLLLERVRAVTPRMPIVVTGDFNSPQDGAVYQSITAKQTGVCCLADSWTLAEKREAEGMSTFNGFTGPKAMNQRIDWILVSEEFKCERAKIVVFKDGEQFPSDHFPVVSWLKLTVPDPPTAPPK